MGREKGANPYARQWEQFTANISEHELTVLHDDGLYRHLRMARPGTGIWGWSVVTWPGHLATSGDIGEGFIFTREPDMLGFFAKGGGYTYSDGAPQIDIRYWAEKLTRGAQSVKTYSRDVFLQRVRDHIREERGSLSPWRRATLYEDAQDVPESPTLAHQWLDDAFPNCDTWEWDLADWDHHFLLACYAIHATVKARQAREE